MNNNDLHKKDLEENHGELFDFSVEGKLLRKKRKKLLIRSAIREPFIKNNVANESHLGWHVRQMVSKLIFF